LEIKLKKIIGLDDAQSPRGIQYYFKILPIYFQGVCSRFTLIVCKMKLSSQSLHCNSEGQALPVTQKSRDLHFGHHIYAPLNALCVPNNIIL